MSIALIVTRGFGNGSLTGAITEVVTAGYTIGEPADLYLFVDSANINLSSSANNCYKGSSNRNLSATSKIRLLSCQKF